MADGNGGPLAGLRGYFQEINRLDDEIAAHRAECVEACEPAREAIKEIMKSAKEAGLNARAFREALAVHRADRAHERRVGAMDPVDAQDLDRMLVALGVLADTPLGAAAIERFEDASSSV